MNTPLTQHLNKKNFYNIEGYSQQVPDQVKALNYLSQQTQIKNILEIGFNAGHSSEIFLNAKNDTKVTSFDLASHDYVIHGKSYIDKTFPFRHSLIIGDSTKTIPEFKQIYPNTKFDLIFIDGGHDYEIAKQDIINCKEMAHQNTIVIMDDTIHKNEWTKCWNIGPTRAWNEAVKNNTIKETNKLDFEPGRGMAYGKYVF